MILYWASQESQGVQFRSQNGEFDFFSSLEQIRSVMTQKHGKRQQEHCHLGVFLSHKYMLENNLSKISTGHYAQQCLISEREKGLGEGRVCICEAAESAGKVICKFLSGSVE